MFADQLQQRRGEMEMTHDRLNGWNSAKYDTVCNYEPALEVFNRQTLHIRQTLIRKGDSGEEIDSMSEWQSRTGKYLAQVHDVRTERGEVHAL